ncbi:MAG: serine hydrolase [Planctomycetes bacterium]|nr:serine hydrolase [Planctomycetota bacterium]
MSITPRLPQLVLAIVLALSIATRSTAQVAVYHGVSSATHQTQWTTLSGQGYRPIALSVSGGMAAQRYSAVWVRRSGPRFAGVHGLTRAQYASWRTSTRAAGYRPLLVTASGAGTDEVFAAVYVADNNTAVVDEYEATAATIHSKMDWAWSNGFIPVCIEEYGTTTAPRFCGVWEPYSGDAAWGYSIQDTATGYQEVFDAHTEAHARPVFVDISDRQTYSSIWRDDQVGSWTALHDLTATAFQNEINNRPGQFPLFAQCGGSGTAARWVTCFVTSDTVRARTLSRSGIAVPALAALDDYVADLVQDNDARAAALAIAKNGRLVLARGYTWAEPGYPITQPTSMFRIASCSKPLTALGAHVLDQDPSFIFSMNTLVAANLGLNGTDPSFNTVRVRHTIQHSSGVLRDTNSWTIAQWMNPLFPVLPVTAAATASYAATQPLLFPPGTGDQYSNVAYTLLGQVLENVAGKSFERVLREDVAAPLGVTRLWIGGSRRSQLRTGEVYYHDDRLAIGPSDLHTDRRRLAGTYGGGSYGNIPRIDAPGGVVTSAVDYVRILTGAYELARDGVLLTPTTANNALAAPVAPVAVDLGGFAQDPRSGGVVAHGKSGVLPGVSTQVIHRSDGISIAVFVNKSSSHANRATLNQLVEGVTSWPTHDLFPTYGLPAFPRIVPRVETVQTASLPNVTDSAFVVIGEVFSGVDRVSFGSNSITNPGSWASGWFTIVSDQRIEIHPPQGLAPSTYTARLWNGLAASDPFDLSVTSTTSLLLGGPATTFTGFELVAARGRASASSLALLCLSPSNVRSYLPGIVDLGLGAGFSLIETWPDALAFNPFTGCARWQVPDPGLGTWYFQVLLFDPIARDPTPFPTTNVHAVRGL